MVPYVYKAGVQAQRPSMRGVLLLASVVLALACNDPVVGSMTGTASMTDTDTGTSTSSMTGTGTGGSSGPDTASGVVDSSDGGSSGLTSSTRGAPPTACVETDWVWTEDPLATSFVSGLAFDTDIKVLQRRGDNHVMRGFDLDGGPTLDPVVIGEGFQGEIDARPTGGVLLSHSSDGVSSLQWRSANGVLTDTIDLSSMGDQIQWSTVLAHSDGSHLMGGMAWVDDHPESALVALAPSGTVAWEHRGEHAVIDQLEAGPGSSTLALIIATPHPDGDRLIESYGPAGELQWSLGVGSIGPGDSEDSTPSFTFTRDDDGGLLTLGTRLTAEAEERDVEAFAVVSRYDQDGVLWSTEIPADDPEDLVLGVGAVTVVGGRVVAVIGRFRPLVIVMDMQGTVLCQQRIDAGDSKLLVSDLVPDSEDGFVAGGQTWDPHQAWLARFEVVTP